MANIFPKENFTVKPEKCFPAFMDGIPSIPVSIDQCASSRRIRTRHLPTETYQMPSNIGDNQLLIPWAIFHFCKQLISALNNGYGRGCIIYLQAIAVSEFSSLSPPVRKARITPKIILDMHKSLDSLCWQLDPFQMSTKVCVPNATLYLSQVTPRDSIRFDP